MESKGIVGVSTLFRRWSGSAWVNISEITNITGPGLARGTVEFTSMSSTDKYREFLGGFRDSGTVVIAMIFRRDMYDLMKDDFEDDDTKNYEIVFPDAENTSLEFEGLVTELGLTTPAEDKVTSDVTIKVSGKVEINSGSGSRS